MEDCGVCGDVLLGNTRECRPASCRPRWLSRSSPHPKPPAECMSSMGHLAEHIQRAFMLGAAPVHGQTSESLADHGHWVIVSHNFRW